MEIRQRTLDPLQRKTIHKYILFRPLLPLRFHFQLYLCTSRFSKFRIALDEGHRFVFQSENNQQASGTGWTGMTVSFDNSSIHQSFKNNLINYYFNWLT